MQNYNYLAAIPVFLLLMTLGGCFEPPEYPNEPQISFRNVRFVEAPGPDSLVISFDFTDGDGDLGLQVSDTLIPFHSFNYVLDGRTRFRFSPTLQASRVVDSTVRFVTFNQTDFEYPLYLVDRNFGILMGILSEGNYQLPPFSCKEYIINRFVEAGTNREIIDTFFIQPNEFSWNMVLEVYRKRNGQYTNITESLLSNDCRKTFGVRFPIFDQNNLGRPLRGTIHYPWLSNAHKLIFLNDSIMIEFFIYDQALNKSNVVRTRDFTLPGLLGIR